MLETIEYGDTVLWCQGRNGISKQVGLELMSRFQDRDENDKPVNFITLTPIGKRGVVNACLNFPVDKVDDLIEVLKKLKAAAPPR